MTFTDWVPAVFTSTVLAALGSSVLLGLKATIEKGIQSTFEWKLEAIKSDLRLNEERLRADLKLRDAEVDALRRGPLSGIASRQALLEKRRLEAMEKVWASVVGMAHLRTLCLMAENVNLDVMAKIALQKTAEGNGAREFARALCEASKLGDLADLENCQTSRPFVPPALWTAYCAFAGVVLRTAFCFIAAREGMKQQPAETTKIVALVKEVLPGMAQFVDDGGPENLHYLALQLEERVVECLMENLWGGEMDQAAVKQTAAVMRFLDDVVSERIPPIPDNLRA